LSRLMICQEDREPQNQHHKGNGIYNQPGLYVESLKCRKELLHCDVISSMVWKDYSACEFAFT
jgi:hypothetical protein